MSAWGNNASGELGTLTAPQCTSGISECSSATAVLVDGLTDVVELAAGYSTVYALKSDGTVWAWGDNTYGEAGPNATTTPSTQFNSDTPQYTPVRITGLPPIAHLAASVTDGLAQGRDGSVWVWGDNHDGAFGNGTSGNAGGVMQSAAPVRVSNISTAVSIGATGSAFHGSGFAVLADGTLWSWGHNRYGQLGYPTGSYPYSAQLTPQQVPGTAGVQQVAGGSDTTYAVVTGQPQ